MRLAEDSVVAAEEERRPQMLRAALEVIIERGFPDTRIADVAERAGTSPALVIYYFKTKDRLLTEAMRHAEDVWYEAGAARTASLPTAAARLEAVVAMSCLPDESEQFLDSWVVWLDLWAQAVRHPEVAAVRADFDTRWRGTIAEIVRQGQAAGEFCQLDADDFAVAFSALLDGLAVQIALSDRAVDAGRAFTVAMTTASKLLCFEWGPARRRNRRPVGSSRTRRARAGS